MRNGDRCIKILIWAWDLLAILDQLILCCSLWSWCYCLHSICWSCLQIQLLQGIYHLKYCLLNNKNTSSKKYHSYLESNKAGKKGALVFQIKQSVSFDSYFKDVFRHIQNGTENRQYVIKSSTWGFANEGSDMVVFLMIYIYRIFWESKKFEGHTDKVEPWYETPYSVEKITCSMIQVCRKVGLKWEVALFVACQFSFRFMNLNYLDGKTWLFFWIYIFNCRNGC